MHACGFRFIEPMPPSISDEEKGSDICNKLELAAPGRQRWACEAYYLRDCSIAVCLGIHVSTTAGLYLADDLRVHGGGAKRD